jgi:hypothetical protein
MKRKSKPFFSLALLFIFLNAFMITGNRRLEGWGFDQEILIYGNLVLFGATLLSCILALRGLKSTNPHAFVRSVMGSIMVKMLICLLAALVYILMNRDHINKPSLFILMGFYLLYTFMEVVILMKIAKQKANA